MVDEADISEEDFDTTIKAFTRTVLRKKEKRIDNSSTTISKETGISPHTVNIIIDRYISTKLKELHNRIKNNKQ